MNKLELLYIFAKRREMIVLFDQDYLKELYVSGVCRDKSYRFQPSIISKYVWIIKLMCSLEDVSGLMKYNSLHYERLKGDKQGLSSVRINKKYRIEFKEILEISNHYK